MHIKLPSESRTYRDRRTGVSVRQLTSYLGHSHHIYFTNLGWWDENRRILIGTHRGGVRHLGSIELESGEITLLHQNSGTEYEAAEASPVRPEAYFAAGTTLNALNLLNGEERTLYTAPDGWTFTNVNATCDGEYVCTAIREPKDLGIEMDLGNGYVGFKELFESHPRSRILKVPVDGGPVEVLHEEDNWITHINTSPTLPDVLTFCHEGPWDLVKQRMWTLNLASGAVAKLREQGPGEAMGHEYWMADGETVGYHGYSDGKPLYGFIRYDNTNALELPFPYDSNHYHSLDTDLIVGDGAQYPNTPWLLLYKRNGDVFEAPRILGIHRSSRNSQILHVHPCFSPDGSKVLFTSDQSGYGQIYLADLPEDIESLPLLDAGSN